MPIRGGTPGNHPFKTACNNIRKTADRVYGHNSPRAQACKRMVDVAQRVAEREEHTPDYNPYQALANRLKKDFPRVWNGDEHNSGRKALAPWGAT